MAPMAYALILKPCTICFHGKGHEATGITLVLALLGREMRFPLDVKLDLAPGSEKPVNKTVMTVGVARLLSNPAELHIAGETNSRENNKSVGRPLWHMKNYRASTKPYVTRTKRGSTMKVEQQPVKTNSDKTRRARRSPKET
ncbi:hypothetical protein T10_6540 [Trichinella papuae]|uniref:Uncharacterized protein n=1 Tax=Trichinella papuae TaxID=268474 RepID=A0A0V1M105_9BILA|nr:hypothetical protein T10_6540 [Trichinella papuae]